MTSTMNTKIKQNMANGKKEGIRKGAETGIWGEYSTISRENNVCNNSREIKDFIKKYSDPVLPHCLIQNPPLRFKLQVSKKIKAFL
jgi:hypothetical protein